MVVASVADEYRRTDMGAKVAAADSHGLIALMFDELIASLGVARAACARGDRAVRSRASSRALSIVAGMSGALDAERGGEVAALLGAFYGRVTGDIIAAAREESEPLFAAIVGRVEDIASAWRLIGPGTPPALP